MSGQPQRDFDAKSLYKDIKQSIEADKLYWIRNDAKIRAATTSQSYDEFRDIVAAAHLNPLSLNDKREKTKIGWNRCASDKINGEHE